jgi:hypothetical protein
MSDVLKPCPFCGESLFEKRRKNNPYACCQTEGCKGSKLPLLNLDMPEDIAAWNTRALFSMASMTSAEIVTGDGWTHDKPTQPGAYWIRCFLLEADALVKVQIVDGALWCNLHLVNTEPSLEYGYSIAQLSPVFEWLGPLMPKVVPHA